MVHAFNPSTREDYKKGGDSSHSLILRLLEAEFVGEHGTVVVLGYPDLWGSQDILRDALGQLWGYRPTLGQLWRLEPWRKGVLTIGKPGYLKLGCSGGWCPCRI